MGDPDRDLTAVPDGPNVTVLNAWIQYGPNQTLIARAVVADDHCPTAWIGRDQTPMAPRRLSFSNISKTVCEVAVPPGTKRVQIKDRVLHVPKGEAKRILVLGDSGCRIKFIDPEKGSKIQACNNPEKWPFATVAASAAQWKPDLIIHVGDYHYREADCPPGHPECLGSEKGNSWESWDQDFFTPGAPLLQAAPWVFVRGNHELCSRGGAGWFQFLDPRTVPPSCIDATPPYVVSVGNHSLTVIDSADDKNIQPSLDQLQYPTGAIAWLLLHRPFLTPGADDEAHGKSKLTEALSAPGKVGVVFTGHKHFVSFDQFNSELPPEIISGNGGTSLEKPPQKGQTLSDFSSPEYSAKQYWDFGFMTLENLSGGLWKVIAHDKNGQAIIECKMIESRKAKTTLTCGEPKKTATETQTGQNAPALSLTVPEVCTKKNGYLEKFFTSFTGDLKKSDPEAPPPNCILAAQNSYDIDDNYGFCATASGAPKQDRSRPCVSKNYAATVYDSFMKVSRCLKIEPRQLIPVFALESGFHVNSVGDGRDAGISQLTRSGIEAVNSFYERAHKAVLADSSPNCQYTAKYFQKLNPDVSHRCAAMHFPENPTLSLIYGSLLYKANFDSATSGLQRYKAKIPPGVDQYGLTAAIANIGYNAGVGNAVACLGAYLKLRKYHVSQKDFDFQSKDKGGFVSFMSDHFPVPPGQEKRRQTAAGYFGGIEVYASRLDEAVGPGACSDPKVYGAKL